MYWHFVSYVCCQSPLHVILCSRIDSSPSFDCFCLGTVGIPSDMDSSLPKQFHRQKVNLHSILASADEGGPVLARPGVFFSLLTVLPCETSDFPVIWLSFA